METIDRATTEPLERIAALVARRGIRTLVVGLPLRLDGSEGASAEKVRAFAQKLRERLPELPLVFVDETLTTTAAAGKLRAAGKRRSSKKASSTKPPRSRFSTRGWKSLKV